MVIIRRPVASAILFWENSLKNASCNRLMPHRGNRSADLRIGTNRLFPVNHAESEFGAPELRPHRETQWRGERGESQSWFDRPFKSVFFRSSRGNEALIGLTVHV